MPLEPSKIMAQEWLNAARYPGPFEPITEEEFMESLRIAEAVVAWAETRI